MLILSAFFFACMNVQCASGRRSVICAEELFSVTGGGNFCSDHLGTRKHIVPKVQKQYWGPLFLRCAFGTLGILCNFYAIDHLLVADASILNKLSPFFAIIFSFLLLKEKITPTQGACVLLAFIGCFVCCETGVPECSPGSGTDRSLRRTWSRDCLYNGACAREHME